MRSSLRSVMPSMFHRRLLLLVGAMVVVLAVLGTATTMLATGQTHKDARALAESKLRRQQMIETKRGAILDRNGLVLAEDEPGWELAVHFDLLTGKWGYHQAYADASRDKLAWGEMSQNAREARVAELQREYDQQTEAVFVTLAELSGVGADEVQMRRRATVAGPAIAVIPLAAVAGGGVKRARRAGAARGGGQADQGGDLAPRFDPGPERPAASTN